MITIFYRYKVQPEGSKNEWSRIQLAEALAAKWVMARDEEVEYMAFRHEVHLGIIWKE